MRILEKNPKLGYDKILDALRVGDLLVSHSIKDPNKKIEFLSHSSLQIEQNALFFCKGARFREEYLDEAIKKGAICYMAEQKFAPKDCDHIIVGDIYRAMALVAPLYYGYPHKNLFLSGVTGTKGKTTTTHFLKNIFDAHAKTQTGLLSSIETYTGKRRDESHNSTPEPCDLQRFFYEAVESGIKYFSMEVSSQAYKAHRVDDITFDNGIFLNFSEDHISPIEHEDIEDYLCCKLEFMKNCSNIVINCETDCFDRVLAAAKSSKTLKQITLFGSEKSKGLCDYYYSEIRKEGSNQSFILKNDKTGYMAKFSVSIPGRFNIENAAAAATLSKTLNIGDEDIRAGLLQTQMPGRMNIFENNGITVIVDYAHNLLSFTRLYESLKQDYPGQRIISLGGAPGEKAYRRRKDFADVVGGSSDFVYLTAEDPQFENVEEICAAIAAHMMDTPYEIIPNRAEAVKKAIQNAKPGDVVVLLAKGEEDYQKVRGKYEFYESDLKLAESILFEKI